MRLEWGTSRARSRDLPAIASYHVALTSSRPHDSLDQRTWDDLDLDDVFSALDRTESSVGQQQLYHRLRSFSAVNTLPAFESLVARLSSDNPLRERCQIALSRLAAASGYHVWALAQPGSIDVRAWHVVFPILTFFVVALAVLSALAWPQVLLALAVIGPTCLVLRIATAKRIGGVIDAFRYIGPLLATAYAVRALHSADTEALTGALRVNLPQLSQLRLLSGWLARDSFAMDPLSGAVIELLNSVLLLDANALLFGAVQLRRHGAALEHTLAAVGEIDAAIAVASYRAGETTWARPAVQPGAAIKIRDLRHPLLPDGVPNSIDLAPPNGVLITGSNMSGKSTFLRALGLAAVLSRTINTCPASAYLAPSLIVRSCIGRRDNVVEGRSYYLDEVLGVLDALRASRSAERHLFLFDELFRGTNAIERIAASEATLREFAETPHLVVTATHDVEVVNLLQDLYAPFHFADRMGPEGLVFDTACARDPGRRETQSRCWSFTERRQASWHERGDDRPNSRASALRMRSESVGRTNARGRHSPDTP